MKRAVVALLASGLLVAGLMTPVAAKDARTDSEPYTMAEGMVVFGTGAEWSLGTQYIDFDARPGERYVDFRIDDDSGLDARGHIWVDPDGDTAYEMVRDFCNETNRPLRVRRSQKILISVIFGTCDDGTPSVVTQGTITATFSR